MITPTNKMITITLCLLLGVARSGKYNDNVNALAADPQDPLRVMKSILNSSSRRCMLEVDPSYLKIEGLNTRKLKKEINNWIRKGQALLVTPAWLANIPAAWRNNFTPNPNWKGKATTTSEKNAGKNKTGKTDKATMKKNETDGLAGFGKSEIKFDANGKMKGLSFTDRSIEAFSRGATTIFVKIGDSLIAIAAEFAGLFKNLFNGYFENSKGTRATEVTKKQMKYGQTNSQHATYIACLTAHGNGKDDSYLEKFCMPLLPEYQRVCKTCNGRGTLPHWTGRYDCPTCNGRG